MADLYDAYKLLDQNLESNLTPIAIRAESSFKAMLARRQGLPIKGDLNLDYEIEMRLVPRKKSLSDAAIASYFSATGQFNWPLDEGGSQCEDRKE